MEISDLRKLYQAYAEILRNFDGRETFPHGLLHNFYVVSHHYCLLNGVDLPKTLARQEVDSLHANLIKNPELDKLLAEKGVTNEVN